MIAPFSTAELRRLSEAATRHEMDSAHGPGDHSSLVVYVDGPIVRNRADCTMLAYLGTHRDAILRMLEAADALALSVDAAVTWGKRGVRGDDIAASLSVARDAYKKARGE